ncbi:MAG: phage capsid protein [Gammaproteobacteria bacterium]
MSVQVTTAFSQQFSSNVYLLSQQKGSKLRGAVREESVTGEKAFFDQIGKTAAIAKTTRHGDTPLVETPHSRRMVTMTTYEWADLVDDSDKVKMLIDPTSSYAQAAAYAMGRAIDDEIIAAATGTAKTGKAGSTSTSMLAANQIANGGTNMTIAKLLDAKKIMDEADVDPDSRHVVVSPAAIESLLNTTEVKSSDFNTVKALAQGSLDSYLGFRFHTSTRLALSGNIRTCFAFQGDALMLAVGKDVTARIDERSDKSYSTQVYYCMSVGSTRMEEEKVVQIDIDESA